MCAKREILAKVDSQRPSREIKQKVASEKRTNESKTEFYDSANYISLTWNICNVAILNGYCIVNASCHKFCGHIP